MLIDAVSDEDEDEEVLIRREKGLEGILVDVDVDVGERWFVDFVCRL